MPIINKDTEYPANSIYDLVAKYDTSGDAEKLVTVEFTSKRIQKLAERPLIYARVDWVEYKHSEYNYTTYGRVDRYAFKLRLTGVIRSTKFTGSFLSIRADIWGRNPTKTFYVCGSTAKDAKTTRKELMEFMQTEQGAYSDHRDRHNIPVYEFYDKKELDKILAKESALHTILADFTLYVATLSTNWYTRNQQPYTEEDLCKKETWEKRFRHGVRFIVSRFKNGNLRVDRYPISCYYNGPKVQGALIRSKTSNVLKKAVDITSFPAAVCPVDYTKYTEAFSYPYPHFYQDVVYMEAAPIPPSDELLKELKNQMTLEIL